MTQRESGVEQAARVLPLRLRSGVMSLPEDRRSQIEELRLRVGLPMAAVLPEGERALAGPPVTQQSWSSCWNWPAGPLSTPCWTSSAGGT